MKKNLVILFLIVTNLFYSQTIDEFQIYAQFITNNYSKTKKKIILQKQTYTLSQEKIRELKYKNLKANFKNLNQDAFNDFITKNKSKNVIQNSFEIKLNVSLIDEKEIADIFKSHTGWDDFYKKYKNSNGILEFSKIGFNTEKTQAFFYYSTTAGYENGSGNYILFEKKNGKWNYIFSLMAWIS